MDDKEFKDILNKKYEELSINPDDKEYTRYLEEKLLKVLKYYNTHRDSKEMILETIDKVLPSFIQEYERMRTNINNITNSLDSNFGISINFELIELFNIANLCSNNDDFINLRDEYFERISSEPKFMGHDPIFAGLRELTYEDTLKIYNNVVNNVDCITPEFEGKMRFIIDQDKPLFINGEVNKDAFDFKYLDKIADFARKNNMQLRMHNIIWHNDFLPCFNDLSNEDIYKFLDSYMNTISERYGDVIYSVDVLNEIASDEENEILRNSEWKNKLGDNYFIEVLKIAKKNFPNCELYYNDYGEQNENKRNNIMSVVNMIKRVEEEENISLLDGIGLQSHYSVKTSDNDIKDAYRDLTSLGKNIQVTELDVSYKEETNGFDYDTNRVFRTVLDCASSYGIKLLNLWGVSSNISWKSGKINNFLDENNEVSEYSEKMIDAYSRKKKLNKVNSINQNL